MINFSESKRLFNNTFSESSFMESYIVDTEKTLKEITELFKQYDIDFMFIGGMARIIYGYNSTTCDVDVVIAKEDKQKLLNLPIGYIRKVTDKVFNLHEPKTRIEIIYTGEISGDGVKGLPFTLKDKNDAKDYPVIDFKKFIEFKLSSGMYSKENRYKDFDDVQQFIKLKNLPRTYGNNFRKDLKDKYLTIWDNIHDNK